MKVSKIALVAVLLGGSVAYHVSPADAQRAPTQRGQGDRGTPTPRSQQQTQQQVMPTLQGYPELSAEERATLTPVIAAVNGGDWAAAQAALPAAEAAAQSAQARYFVARLRFEIARGTGNAALEAQAVDAMLASGATPAEDVQTLLRAQANRAVQAENWALAEQALTRLLELTPNDTERLRLLAEVKIRLNKRAEAFDIYQRLIQQTQAAGETVPEIAIRQTMGLAADAGRNAEALQIARQLVQAYPSPTNWRDALLIYSRHVRPDEPLEADILRMMRATQAMDDGNLYLSLADLANRGGLIGEAKAVLDEGIARGRVNRSTPGVAEILSSAERRLAEDRAAMASERQQALAASTGRRARSLADALFGYGEYADAASLYRTALEKGGEDASLVNLRMGAALALAGRRSEAEAALRAVSGQRQGLAELWLAWLASRAG